MFRQSLASGSFKTPDNKDGKWNLTINVDGKVISMEIEIGTDKKGTIEYLVEDMLFDAYSKVNGEK